MNTFRISLLSVVLASISSTACGGPDWDEGAKDAGSLPATAQTVSASTSTATTRVRGTTSAGVVTGDLVDMYLVKVGSDPSQFKFDMNMGAGGAPAWSARLTLFKKVVVNCGTIPPNYVTLGKPIATVVKASAGSPFPILDGTVVVNAGTATLGSLMIPNAEYYVAVSGLTNLPIGLSTDCSGTGTTKTLFLNTNAFGIYLPDINDALYHVTGWTNPSDAATGACSMLVSSVYPLPASSCSDYVPVNGSPTEKAFDFGFAPATTGTVSCASGYTVNREFFYLWTPNCSGSADVTTCGYTSADSAIEVFALDPCNSDACTAAASSSIACNDECGTGNASKVTFAATAGHQYLIRLTRLTGSATTGTIKFTCAASLGSRDINGDGIVDAADLALLLGSWGTSGN